MGRLGALLRPTWQSYAGLPPEEGAFCRLAAAALPLAAKTKQPGFARWKCTPIGAALRLGFKGFRKFKRFRGCGIALRAMSFRISLREMENQTTGLRPLEMHPFWCCAPLPPEGEVCSMLNINLIRCEQHFGD